MSWVFRQSEPGLYTTGFYDPNGGWWPESDYNSKEAAANRVSFLNGGERITPAIVEMRGQAQMEAEE